ncbi:MAG: hypothetical protein HQM00_02260 [Magnetococcales bacterium]|nr:hypothetical protein [Magnetococcales bacterium]
MSDHEAILNEDAQDQDVLEMEEGSETEDRTEAENTEGEKGKEAPFNPRQAALDLIAEQREKELLGETGEENEQNAVDADDTGDPETPPASKEPIRGRRAEDHDRITVIVDGVEREVPVSEVRAAYQIEKAARQRMTQAAILDKALNDRAEFLAAKERELLAKEQSLQGGKENGEPAKATVDKAAALHAALYSEDPANIDAVLRDYVKEIVPQQSGQPPVEIATQVRHEVRRAQLSNQVQQAQQVIAQEFPDISKDPILAKLADEFVGSEFQKDPNQDMIRLFRSGCIHARKTAEQMYQRVRQHAGQTPIQTSRQDLKRQTTKLQAPVGIGRSASPVKKESREPTARDELNELRRMRGQAS